MIKNLSFMLVNSSKLFLFIPVLFFNVWGAFLDLAFEAHQRGEIKKAESYYEKAIEDGDNLAIIYFNLGNLYYAQGKLAKAVVSYEKTISILPDFTDAYLNLGRLHYLYGSYNRALEIFRALYKRDNNDFTLNMLLGDTYRKLRLFREAEEHYNLSTQLEPQKEDGFIALADLYLEFNDQEAARKNVVAGYQSVDFSKNLILYEGNLLKEQKKYDESIAVYRSVLASDHVTNFTQDEQYEILLKIVDALLLDGNENFALYELEQIVNKYPDKDIGVHYLENIYVNKKKGERGYSFFKNFYDKNSFLAEKSMKTLLAYAYSENELFLVKDIVAFMSQKKIRDELVTAIKNELNL